MSMPWMHKPRWYQSPAVYFASAAVMAVSIAWFLVTRRADAGPDTTRHAAEAFLCGTAVACASYLWVSLLVFDSWDAWAETLLVPSLRERPRQYQGPKYWVPYMIFMLAITGVPLLGLPLCFGRMELAGFWYFEGAALVVAVFAEVYRRKVWRRAWEIYRERQQARPQHSTPAA